jgi:hypothetical protein
MRKLQSFIVGAWCRPQYMSLHDINTSIVKLLEGLATLKVAEFRVRRGENEANKAVLEAFPKSGFTVWRDCEEIDQCRP